MKLRNNLLIALAVVGLIWAVYLVDMLLPGELARFGIRPRSLAGLWGIPASPFLHAGIPHLIANSGALFVLLVLALSVDRVLAAEAIVIIIVVGGGLVWLFGAPRTVHVGASGVIFGLIGFLLFAGFFRTGPQGAPGGHHRVFHVRRRPVHGVCAHAGGELDRTCFRVSGRRPGGLAGRRGQKVGKRLIMSILVAAKETSVWRFFHGLKNGQLRVELTGDGSEAIDIFRRKRFECTFIDLGLLWSAATPPTPEDIRAALAPFRKFYPTAPIVVMADRSQVRELVLAVKAGAFSYLTCPLNKDEVEFVLESIAGRQQAAEEIRHFRDDAMGEGDEEGARTRSPVMRDVLEKIRSVAATRTTVLLTGETGSGKGVMARLIHRWSHRREGPFIAVHCGAVPDTLLESEFFGHEKGAFTGAVRRKLGKFQIADGGTLFLDEIGTISPAAQVKMLQVLQERRFTRVGGEDPIEVDVRLLAATNMDLGSLCREGLFRQDLYYRLNVFPIEIPPLRRRAEDIPMLLENILGRLGRQQGREIHSAAPEVLSALTRYAWPGNIRELENLIERAFILERGNALSAAVFPSELFALEGVTDASLPDRMPTLEEVRKNALEQVELRYLKEITGLAQGAHRP